MFRKLIFLKQLWSILNIKERVALWKLVFLSTCTGILQSAGLISVLPFIAVLLNPQKIFADSRLNWLYTYLNIQSTEAFLFLLGVGVFTLLVLSNLLSIWLVSQRFRFVWENNHRLSVQLIDTYLHMPYEFFLRKHSSDLSKNILNEVFNLTSSFLFPLVKLITDIVVIILVGVTLFFIEPRVAVCAILVIGGGYTLTYLVLSKYFKEYGKTRIKKIRQMYIAIAESLSAIKELKVYQAESFFTDLVSNQTHTYSEAFRKSKVLQFAPRFLMELIVFGGLIFGLLTVMLLGYNMTGILPVVSAFAFAGYRLMPLFQDVYSSFASFRFNKGSLDKIYADLNLQIRDLDASSTIHAVPNQSDQPFFSSYTIELKEVSYQYPGTTAPVLEKVDIQIKEGEKCIIIGETGSGKSTFINLILGLISPTDGHITIGGKQLDSRYLREWQSRIGYVPQDIVLLDMSIAENIAFGSAKSDIDRERIKTVCRLAQIDTFIESLPEGYNTRVGERGVRLSGGQRQRIGIARALYRKPDILVFDEATGALDESTANAVLENIFTDTTSEKEYTVLFITHNNNSIFRKNAQTIRVEDKQLKRVAV